MMQYHPQKPSKISVPEPRRPLQQDLRYVHIQPHEKPKLAFHLHARRAANLEVVYRPGKGHTHPAPPQTEILN
jgi:hypothetical protein